MLSLPPPPVTLAPAPPPHGALVRADHGAPGRGRVPAVERIEALRSRVQARHPRPDPHAAESDGGRSRGLGAGRLPEARRGRATEGFPGASSGFLVQVIGQGRGPVPRPLAQHRDAAVLGSEAYRRAGGQPPLYSDQPTVFRITV